jgi:hypothetical protein
VARQEPPASARGKGTTHTTDHPDGQRGRTGPVPAAAAVPARVHASHQILVRLSSTQVGGGEASASLSIGSPFPLQWSLLRRP